MNQFKTPMNRLVALSRWVSLALPMLAIAHPALESQGKHGGGGVPPNQPVPESDSKDRQFGNQPIAPPAPRGHAVNPGPPTDAAPKKPTISPGESGPKKFRLIDAIELGYKNNVLTCIGQASHEHLAGEQAKSPNPVEIWYVSTRKTSQETPGEPYYCVAPRVESATDREWTRPFVVRLMEDGVQKKAEVVSSIPSGGSQEVFSFCVRQAAPPAWIIETPHGEARVVFPARNMVRPSCGPIANAQTE